MWDVMGAGLVMILLQLTGSSVRLVCAAPLWVTAAGSGGQGRPAPAQAPGAWACATGRQKTSFKCNAIVNQATLDMPLAE